MADGSIIIDTELNSTGFKKGLSGMSKAAKVGIAAISATIGLAGMAAIKVGMDFEEGMSKVAAISGATGEDLDLLTEKAKEMGEQTKFSATEASEAFQYMAMAGWKTQDMLGGIEGIMNLAAASGENLGLVSDIVTDALTAFGLKAKDAGRFADVLAAASSNSNTNVAMMGATFKYAAPIAGALGYTIEDTAVAIGLMANAGIKADQAGTALRSVMTRLAAPPKMAAKAIDKLNLSLTNADGTMKPFSQVIDDLREKFAGMSKEQQVANAKALAGQEAMSGLLAIVNAAPEDVEKLRGAIAESAGAAKKMAEIMQDNLKGQLVILGSTLEGLGIKVYDKFEKPFRAATKSAIKSVTDLSKSMADGKLSRSVDTIATGFGNLVKGTAEFVTKAIPPLINGFALIVAHGSKLLAMYATLKVAMLAHNAIVALTTTVQTMATGSVTGMHIAIGVLTGRVKLATAAQLAWSAALSLNPIGLAVTAVAALAAGIGILILTQEKQVSEMDILTESIHKQKDSWDELKAAQVEGRDEKLAEIDHTKQLWKELQTLIDANGKVIGDKERAKFITMELNAIAPDSIKWTEQETVAIDKNAESIDRLLEKKRAQLILDSQEPAYQEALASYQEKQNEQAKLSLKLKEAQKAVEEARQAVEKGGGDIALQVLEEKKKAVADLQVVYDENTIFLNDYYKSIADYERLSSAIMNGNYDEIGAILKGYGTNLKTATTATREELEAQAEIANENARLVREAFNNHVEGVTEDMVKIVEEGAKAAQEEVEKSRKNFEEAGKNIAAGFAKGIEVGGKAYVNPVMAKMVQGSLQATNKASDSHSPSRLFQNKAGNYIAAGFALGITSHLGVVSKAATQMVGVAFNWAQESLDQADFGSIGKRMIGRVNGGMQSAEALLQSTMQTLGEKLMDAHLTNAEKLGLLQAETEKEAYAKMKALGIEEVNKNYLAFMAAEKEKIKTNEAEIEKLKNMTVKERNERVKTVELNAVGKKAEEIAQLEKSLLAKKEQEIEDISVKSKQEKQERIVAIEKKYVEEKNKALLDLEIKSLEDEQKIAEQFTTEYAKTFEKLVTEYENANQKIMDSQTKLEEKLSSFGQLYDTIKDSEGKDTGLFKLHDMQGDIDKLDAYGAALEELKAKKPPDGFMDEVLAMDIDEALGYMKVLNGQTDKDYDAYISKWSEKQNKAKAIAETYYKDQFNTLDKNFNQKIIEQTGLLPDKTKRIGMDITKSLREGMEVNKNSVLAIIEEFSKAFDSMRESANNAQQAAADATGAQANFEASSRSSRVINNDNGVQQTMNFYAPTASPADIARANRKAGKELARG